MGWAACRASASASGSEDGGIRYREQLGLLGVAFDVDLERPSGSMPTGSCRGRTMCCTPTWWSRCSASGLASREAVLLHCASVDTESGAVLLSAQTDTGKTSTLLRLLMQQPWGFMGDDMAIVLPDGRVLSLSKADDRCRCTP